MKSWRLRKLIGATATQLLIFGCGILMGVALIAFLPGMPWSATAKGDILELDLAAQRSMASAAWWMVVITALSAGVGAASLYLIAQTLREARRSADAAKETIAATIWIGKQQVRAYLGVESATYQFGPLLPIMRVDVTVRNSGQSPAVAISGDAQLRIVEFYFDDENETQKRLLAQIETDWAMRDVSASGDAMTYLTFSLLNMRPTLREIVQTPPACAIEIHLSGTYEDVFGDQWPIKAMLGAANLSLEKLANGSGLRVSTQHH